ncbi:MAG: sodium/proton-translocating pyrophosphatase [Hyphomicrobiales bacterium]
MNVSIARQRCAWPRAATKNLTGGLDLAFKVGRDGRAFWLRGLGLLGVALFGFLTGSLGIAATDRTVIDALVALSFGASLISIFARLGGGIFTKGADVGGDMVGKVKPAFRIDPRNPATIADNVGDNVGDCAGMAADLFETYVVTTVATMVLAAISLPEAYKVWGMVLPSLLWRCLHRHFDHRHLFRQARRFQQHHGRALQGVLATGVLSLVALYPVISYVFGGMSVDLGGFTAMNLFWCGVVGLLITAIIWITEYYTGTGKRYDRSSPSLDHRSRHQRDPGSRGFDGSHRRSSSSWRAFS